MRYTSTKYPIDIIIFMIWSILLLPIVLFDIENSIRIILGIPIIIFIPGYVLIFTLFPGKKTERGIDTTERIALSFGLSIAIVPLIGLGLNYTPYGIRLEPILVSIILFIFGVGSIGIYQWNKKTMEERFTVSFNLSFRKSENNLDKALTIILVFVIIVAISSLIYVLIIPRTGEQFTEFYILGSDGVADDYPKTVALGENANVIIGIANHEYRTINYTIEIWLVNQSSIYNEIKHENVTTIENMWFIDKIEVTLDHIPSAVEQTWAPQWETEYSIPINKTGSFTLVFLLFTTQTQEYTVYEDYQDIAEGKIDDSYRELHLIIDVP